MGLHGCIGVTGLYRGFTGLHRGLNGCIGVYRVVWGLHGCMQMT